MKRWMMLALVWALPAQATVLESPLGMVPSAHLLGDRQLELSCHTLLGPSQGQVYQANLGFGATQLGLAYLNGFPGTTTFGPAMEVRHQLIFPSVASPLALSVGGQLALAPENAFGLGNNLFVTFSHDINAKIQGRWMTFATAHLGFMGDFLLRARWMGALEIPLAEWGNGYIEFLGGADRLQPLINAGVKGKPFPWLSLTLASLANPQGTLWERYFALGAAVNFSTKNPAPTVQTPQGKGSLSGTIRDAETRAPVGGVKITAENGDVTVLTASSNEGLYRITELPKGQYQLKLEKPPYAVKTYSVDISADQNRPMDLLLGGP